MNAEEVVEKLKTDERNRSYTERGVMPVFQAGPGAKVLIIGQAPGKKVEESGIPFNDKSGEKLIRWMGIDRETFYSEKIAIVPMDFYYPGKGKTGDLPPRKFIAREYHPQILRMMPDIRLTILIGRYSMDYYLKGKMKKKPDGNGCRLQRVSAGILSDRSSESFEFPLGGKKSLV